MLEIEVVKIKGYCPVYKKGDKIVIDGPKILLDKTDALCQHVLPTILHYSVALDHGVDPVKLGLTKPEDEESAYIQCLDPGEPFTHGGTVVFRFKRITQ
jgi:uncharacterized repeat protein (TIGR04076 family)